MPLELITSPLPRHSLGPDLERRSAFRLCSQLYQTGPHQNRTGRQHFGNGRWQDESGADRAQRLARAVEPSSESPERQV